MSSPHSSRRQPTPVNMPRSPKKARLPLRIPDPGSIAEVPASKNDSDCSVHNDQQMSDRLHRQLAELKINGRILIKVHSGTIFVRGIVQSQHQRLLVISCLRHAAGDLVIRDRLEVAPGTVPASGSSARTWQKSWMLRISGAVTIAGVLIVAFWFTRDDQHGGLIALPVKVRVAGQPAEGAFLALHPAGNLNVSGRTDVAVRSQGRVGGDGNVSWTTFEPADGLVPGEYIVTATWSRPVLVDGEFQPVPNILRHVYGTPEMSPVRLTVPARSGDVSAELIVLDFQ